VHLDAVAPGRHPEVVSRPVAMRLPPRTIEACPAAYHRVGAIGAHEPAVAHRSAVQTYVVGVHPLEGRAPTKVDADVKHPLDE